MDSMQMGSRELGKVCGGGVLVKVIFYFCEYSAGHGKF